jgi:hypothetical protein
VPNEAPQNGFTQSGQSVIVVVDGQDLCLHLVIQGEQSEIGRNGGSRSPAKPGDLGLGIDFAGIKEGLVLKGLL